MLSIKTISASTPVTLSLAAALLLLWPLSTWAELFELIPERHRIDSESGAEIRFSLAFADSATGRAKRLRHPTRFGVITSSGAEDLLGLLQGESRGGQPAYIANYRVKNPGDLRFYAQMQPYWKPDDAVMQVQYAKVIVNAYEIFDGWDEPIGLPLEIEPLARPYSLWSGNLFRGVVRKDGEPVPFARIQVAWRNDGSRKAVPAAFAPQEIKADAAGVFSYAIPFSGWWGFAALVPGDRLLHNPNGELVPMELTALIWVYVEDVLPSSAPASDPNP